MFLPRNDELDRLIDAARDPAESVTAPASGANWQDISTAPKDGTRFVAVGQNYGLDSEAQHTCIAQWFRGCWMEVSDWNEASELKYLTHWMPLPPLPGSAASATADSVTAPVNEAVAYLDIGAGGYIDLGTDLSEEALSRLPKGRHVLVIAGTYGIDGYTPTPPTQAADSVLEDAARWTTEQEHAIRQGHEIAASDGYFEARPQIDSNDRRKVFQAGFERGWDAARKQGANHD